MLFRGNILSSQSCGTNELIKQGAIPVTCIDDFDIIGNFSWHEKTTIY